MLPCNLQSAAARRSGAGGKNCAKPGGVRRFEMNRSRLQVLYEGTVQGVGFRYTVKSLAGGFEVAGTVRNLPDGRVELIVEGLKEELSAFQQAVRESELGHFIRQENVDWQEPQGGLRGFDIIR
jgi:acylphosphatase